MYKRQSLACLTLWGLLLSGALAWALPLPQVAVLTRRHGFGLQCQTTAALPSSKTSTQLNLSLIEILLFSEFQKRYDELITKDRSSPATLQFKPGVPEQDQSPAAYSNEADVTG